jgi:hypothetical protein
LFGDRQAQRAMLTTPVKDADKASAGRTIPYYQDLMAAGSDRNDLYWKGIREWRDALGDIEAPVNLYATWHDFFILSQVDHYLAMRAAGRNPYLTIGNHAHASLETAAGGFREGLAFFISIVAGDPGQYRSGPVRLYVQGSRILRVRARSAGIAMPRPIRPRIAADQCSIRGGPAARIRLRTRHVTTWWCIRRNR